MSWLDVVLMVVATHRGTQLLGWDTITGPIRWRVIRFGYRRAGHEVDDPDQWGDTIESPSKWDQQLDVDAGEGNAPRYLKLVRCWWCLSVWVGGILYGLHELAHDAWHAIVIVATASTGAVILAKTVERMNR